MHFIISSILSKYTINALLIVLMTAVFNHCLSLNIAIFQNLNLCPFALNNVKHCEKSNKLLTRPRKKDYDFSTYSRHQKKLTFFIVNPSCHGKK